MTAARGEAPGPVGVMVDSTEMHNAAEAGYMKDHAPKHGTRKPHRTPSLRKAATGIPGLDELTGGGLPKGRPTLLCGSAGCGKTLLAMEFLVRGVVNYGEPGVFMAFEENTREVAVNFASL